MKHIPGVSHIFFFCRHIFFFFRTKHGNHCMHRLCFDLMMSHFLSAFCSCETVHDVDTHGFLHFAPSNLMTTVEKLSVESNCLHPGGLAKFGFTPFLCCVCYVSQPNTLPLRWIKYGPLNFRYDQWSR